MIFNHDNCKKDKQEILKTFESTILKVLESVEKMNNKFIEQSAKIQIEHFKQLESHTANLMGMMDKHAQDFMELLKEKKEEPILQKLSSLDSPQENVIEKEDFQESPLEEVTNIPIKEGIQVQFDGEEEILPINIS